MFYPHKFEQRGSGAKFNAQYNLRERTHYLDDDSLRFHKSRVVGCYISDAGLMLAVLESVALDYANTRRGFRGVLFDVFGNVVSTRSLDECYSTAKAARKDMWQRWNKIDAKEITREALGREVSRFNSACNDLRAKPDAAP